jgi:proteasome lid subunit RPN8/RPN11
MPVNGLSPQFQFAAWRVPQFPRAIEYPLEVMDEIRAFACDESLQLSRGGDDVGGVLFGTRRDDLIRILTWRPIACDRTQGEGLRLSYNDRMNLAVQLEMARQNADLKDLRPLGWFVSHLQGEVALSESDLETYNGFFPESWQVALVIRPQGNGHARAGFFVREAEGKVQSETSHQCFDLEPQQLASAPPPPVASNVSKAAPVTEPAQREQVPIMTPAPPAPTAQPAPIAPQPQVPIQTAPVPEAVVPVKVVKPIQSAPPLPLAERVPAASPPTPPSLPIQRVEPAKPIPPSPAIPPGAVESPSFQMDEDLPTRERWLWAIPILLALGIAAFMLYQRRAPTSIALRASNEAQTAQLAWDANSRVVRDSDRGEIEINDGGKTSHVALTSEQLHAGKLSYVPLSGDVTFVLTIYPAAGGEPLHDSTRFIAASPPPASVPHAPTEPPQLLPASPPAASAAAPPPDAGRDTLERQVQQLKIELGNERAHSSELQNLVRILENRLSIKPEDRQPH